MNDIAADAEIEVEPHVIDIEFFSFKGNKSDSLINNTTPQAHVAGKNSWFSFTFSESIYLTAINIVCEGYENWNTFDLEVDHIDGTRHDEKVRVSGGQVNLQMGKLSAGFRFRPESKFFSKPKILQVNAIGFTLAEFHQFEWAIKEYEKKIADLAVRTSRFEKLKEDVDTLRLEKITLESEVGKSRAEAEQLKSGNSANRTSLSQQQESLKDVKSQIATAKEQQREAQSEVTDLEKKRDEIVREIRLFPSEIAGFVREGDRNIKSYLLICTPFVVILFIVLYSMFSNAIDLTQIWKRERDVDIWTIFLTRIPFVLLAVAIIEVCGYIVGRLIFEIVRINRQRLEFAKLSIIAKDVSAASAQGLEMPEQDVYDSETKLKMELLREHMKNYTGAEFEYKGSALVSAIAGVAERLAGKVAPKSE